MREAGVKRMLFSSTSSTYGLTDKVPMDEDTPQQPMNPYACSKMAVEWMIHDFAHAYGFGYTLLRYFNACGADPSGEFGEYHDPDIGILCAGGHFTMDMKGAAWAARKYFNFKTVIPCHYKTFPILEQSAGTMVAGLPGVDVRTPEVMEVVEI